MQQVPNRNYALLLLSQNETVDKQKKKINHPSTKNTRDKLLSLDLKRSNNNTATPPPPPKY